MGIIISSSGIVTISSLGLVSLRLRPIIAEAPIYIVLVGSSGLVIDLIITLILSLSLKIIKTLLIYYPSIKRLDSEIVRLYLYNLKAFNYLRS